MSNATLVKQFIDCIWNRQEFERFDEFLHPDFRDHSLPPTLVPDRDGTRKWILNTGLSFHHRTLIEAQVTEGNQSMVKIRMELKHIGIWRGIEPTHLEFAITGFRHFKLKDGLILEHEALIDGQAIENRLKNVSHGCAIAGENLNR